MPFSNRNPSKSSLSVIGNALPQSSMQLGYWHKCNTVLPNSTLCLTSIHYTLLTQNLHYQVFSLSPLLSHCLSVFLLQSLEAL